MSVIRTVPVVTRAQRIEVARVADQVVAEQEALGGPGKKKFKRAVAAGMRELTQTAEAEAVRGAKGCECDAEDLKALRTALEIAIETAVYFLRKALGA